LIAVLTHGTSPKATPSKSPATYETGRRLADRRLKRKAVRLFCLFSVSNAVLLDFSSVPLLVLHGTANETIRNPMKYTLGTAATATGKSKATIHRAVKSGKLSASRCDDGSYEIDPAELHRVFPPVSAERCTEQQTRQSVTPDETALLRQENDFLRQQLEREKELSRELSRRLDDEAAERRKLTALLTHQPTPKPETAPEATPEPAPTASKGKLWQKLFKRGLP